uniref:Uncharacterized protein n=2 Tax=Timema TaxID=61471 RepID=A0A7R9D0C8_TIMPO|nr:unnamed protein product [Timema douglasi]CAD7405732.1 unnamed protein product [Timema poppensis]
MAEYELKSKQQQRMLRWQMLKMKIYERNCEAVIPSLEQTNSTRLEKCEEIDSLNSFMCLLKESSVYILRRNVNLWASCDSLGESGRGRLARWAYKGSTRVETSKDLGHNVAAVTMVLLYFALQTAGCSDE